MRQSLGLRAAAHLLVVLLVVVLLAAPALGAGRAVTPRTVGWARVHANANLAVDLHDYYGLTLRFVSARTGATCAGRGVAVTADGVRRWWTFRCATHVRSDEGTEFPAVAAVTLTLRVPTADGARPTVSDVRVTACAGKACPVH